MNTIDPLSNAASQMFAARAEDELPTLADMYARNPEAMQFYLRGVKDVINTIAIVRQENDADTLAVVLEALDAETAQLVQSPVQ